MRVTEPVARKLRNTPITIAGGASASSNALAMAAIPMTVRPSAATLATTTPTTIARITALAMSISRGLISAAYSASISVAATRMVPSAR
jgi:hypothetical protein